jgi:plasmid stability protein
VSFSERIDLRLPDEIARALRAEAARQLVSPGRVVVEVLRQSLPGYVERQIRRDLAHPIAGEVIEACCRPTASSNATTRPAKPAARRDELSLNAGPSLPLARPKSEAGGGSA